MPPVARLTPLFLCLLLWVPTAQAQQEEEDDRPSELPDIAPREVEIRGRLDIAFPALRRPATGGLLPEASLQPLPPLAAPRVETVEPPAASPRALPDTDTEPSGFAALPSPQTGLLEAGGGRYFSRFGRGRLNLSLAPRWAFRSRVDYDGTDGFTPFEEQDVQTPSDHLRGALTLRTEQPGFDVHLTADGFLAQHQLYGAERRSAGASVRAFPGRDRYGGGGALHLETAGPLPLEGRVRYDGARIETNVFESDEDEENERFARGEQRLRASLKVSTPPGGLGLELSAQGSTARLTGGGADPGDTNSDFAGTVSFLDAGGGLWLLRGDAYRLFAGARVLPYSTDDEQSTPVAPDVRLEWHPAPHLSLYARTRPGVEAHLLADRYRENPSLLYERAPRPTVRTVDAEGGLRLFPTAGLELHAFAGYQRASNFLFYESSDPDTRPTPFTGGITTARYGNARLLRAGGAVSVRQTERLHASVSVAVRDGQLTDADTDIPYFSPIVAQGLFSYAFLDGDARFQLTGRFESRRPLRRTGDDYVDAFADLDVEATYALTPSIGMVVRLQNLTAGALERYHRYPHPPVIVESGLRVHL